MSKAYTTDAELPHTGISEAIWTLPEMEEIHEAFYRKNYLVNCISRLDYNGIYHDGLTIKRSDIGVISEYLFTQRIRFEAHAEGRDEVAIIFVQNNPAQEIIGGIRKSLPRREVSFL